MIMRETILRILQDIRPDIDFENETGLISDGVLESFDLLSIIAAIGDAADVEINTAELQAEDFESLDSIVHFVEQLKG